MMNNRNRETEQSIADSKPLRLLSRKYSEVPKQPFIRSFASPIAFKRASLVDMLQATAKDNKISKYFQNQMDPSQIFSAERLLKCIMDDNCNKLRCMLKNVNVALILQRSKTVLHEAAYNACINCVTILIKYGFPCHTTDLEGWTPLHAAVLAGNTLVVKYLISIQKNVDMINLNGISPLHVAVYKDNLLLVHLLVQSSGDMFLNGKIMTPFQLAIDMKRSAILDYFILSTTNYFNTIKLT
ncbi:serine/threonine-protein phosphatase 6 regulatory ankyrin repeat subunit B [Hydra vulgaris]|uniref:serine/threonine-protein phosphatase 6 regulatory ankyrin repeat subunit B n=1 Tax=Hydra vulgaris TaxID=6087 RepID=UPI0006410232|nr:serine/threonine-protein phosphatase 6 regulatory ankyrin repeat subunit B [Hydra vulgaris]